MSELSVATILDQIWKALRGDGPMPDFVLTYAALGAVVWGFVLFKGFLQEGLRVATGEHSELPKLLVKYLFVAALFTIWPQAADKLFTGVTAIANFFYPSLDQLLEGMNASLGEISSTGQAATNAQGLTAAILGALYTFTIGNVLNLVGMLVVFLCYGLVLINIAGSLTILAMNLVLGPVFFALAFDRDFRSLSLTWFGTVLSYFMLMPLYGAGLVVAAKLLGIGLTTTMSGLPSGTQILAQLLGPILSVGVIFSTNRVVNTLVGGASGSGAGSIALGLAGIGASLIPGRAMLGATATASRAAAGAVVTTGRSVASGLSSTARAALGNRS
jgi:TrbL/VirB6 plasmid conjugal transfer protein